MKVEEISRAEIASDRQKYNAEENKQERNDRARDEKAE